MDVGMSSIQAYKAHKQGTLVSKVHKQGALGTSSQASIHQWLHCMSNIQAIFSPIFCNLELISISYNYHAGTDVTCTSSNTDHLTYLEILQTLEHALMKLLCNCIEFYL